MMSVRFNPPMSLHGDAALKMLEKVGGEGMPVGKKRAASPKMMEDTAKKAPSKPHKRSKRAKSKAAKSMVARERARNQA